MERMWAIKRDRHKGCMVVFLLFHFSQTARGGTWCMAEWNSLSAPSIFPSHLCLFIYHYQRERERERERETERERERERETEREREREGARERERERER